MHEFIKHNIEILKRKHTKITNLNSTSRNIYMKNINIIKIFEKYVIIM